MIPHDFIQYQSLKYNLLKLILSMHRNLLNISSHCEKDVLDLLEKNLIGTPKQSMLYQHLGVKEKIMHLSETRFINLRTRNSLVGTCCFCKKTISLHDTNIVGFYVRFFSFKSAYQSMVHNTAFSKRDSGLIRQEIKELLSSPMFMSKPEHKSFIYAYVDPRNKRSKRLCDEFGFKEVRSFKNITFSRLFPKDHPGVEQINERDKPWVLNRLLCQYEKYNMFSQENVFYEDNYWVIRNRKGEIVHGVQVHKETWQIQDIPGLSGKLILHVLSKLPVLNRLFKKRFEFLAIEAVIVSPNHEQLLSVLVESLLKKFDVYKALFFVDVASPIHSTLLKMNLGILNRLSKNVMASVICKTTGLTAEEESSLRQQPSYISTFDLT